MTLLQQAQSPGTPRWPTAVRSAELARGTLVRCGPGVRLASWPETPAVRHQALLEHAGLQLMPILMSAAWVWGCARSPGEPVTCSTRGGRRYRERAGPLLSVHEYHYAAHDLVVSAGQALPSPARTACDLVRLIVEFTPEIAVACRLLAAQGSLTAHSWLEALQTQPAAHRARAARRVLALSS